MGVALLYTPRYGLPRYARSLATQRASERTAYSRATPCGWPGVAAGLPLAWGCSWPAAGLGLQLACRWPGVAAGLPLAWGCSWPAAGLGLQLACRWPGVAAGLPLAWGCGWPAAGLRVGPQTDLRGGLFADEQEQQGGADVGCSHRDEGRAEAEMVDHPAQDAAPDEIGRASCRERV